MSFFKAYDMRGTFGVDFGLDTVYRIGKELPAVINEANGDARDKRCRILIGRDARITSDQMRDALISGLIEANAEVVDMGRCTTPMVYFFTATDGYDGSVMITASHNPPSDNGLKVSRRTALPVGYADGLNKIESIIVGSQACRKIDSFGRAADRVQSDGDYLSRYLGWMKKSLPDLSSLKLGIDCSNGMASIFAKEMFQDAIILNGTVDGTFPRHSPNPLKAEAREQLSQLVKSRNLDAGVIFDGDADRCMFVDENGDFVQPDYLIPVIARAELKLHKRLASGRKMTIIHDVRTSRGAIEAIRDLGAEPLMVPVGHAFAKPAIREKQALCGGELAGHYYFERFFGCDSGLLAAIAVLGEVAKAKVSGSGSFSEIMSPISKKYANSGELNFKVEDKDAAIDRVLDSAKILGKEISRSTLDGVRIEYDEGWINIRKSNTEPYLRLIAETDNDSRLDSWVQTLSNAIKGGINQS